MYLQEEIVSRLKEMRKYVNKSLSNMDDKDDMLTAAGHLYGVSTAAQLIAKKRGMDPDADVIDHSFKDSTKPVKEKEQKRYDALCKELGIK